ncbi:hypothetical protein ACFFJN_08595 [Erwinia mallotivora]|uniref:hypothetical protein n=1 Tax=Erwinia mallotivora TaxID=69222 RepID=UPI0035E6F57A
MKKMFSIVSFITLLLTLTGCSGNNLSGYLSPGNLNSLINPDSQQSLTHDTKPVPRISVVWTSGPFPTSVDTTAMRLKQHYGFVSDTDVAAARNSGQGNAGWSASAISEGSSWEAQPGSYYRMSRN